MGNNNDKKLLICHIISKIVKVSESNQNSQKDVQRSNRTSVTSYGSLIKNADNLEWISKANTDRLYESQDRFIQSFVAAI